MKIKLSKHQYNIMKLIAEIPNVKEGVLLQISRRKYPKYLRERDREWGYISPVFVDALKTSANVLVNKGLLIHSRSSGYRLTKAGISYIRGIKND